ncbi:MAG: ABC transporter permease [Pseudonocardiales bacterium]|nr:ABC transporter permease [Pseudonocardiales bacterium]MBV9028909.1 ABC transporter permease [Pseudonocardiales bacterium]MBW0009797.1 ABC transporter permease [Pseudonocardiales bacterium]
MPAAGTTPAVEDSRAFEAGLDALEMPALPPRPGPGTVFLRSVLPPLVAVVAFIALWQLAYSAGLKPSYALPGPRDVLATLGQTVRDGRAAEAISISVSRGALGFMASLVVGTVLGLAMWRSRWLRAALGPFVSGLQSLPSVAWVPAAIIWFGLSDAAIYAVVLLGAVPSIAGGLLAGFDQVPPLLDKVGRVLGLGAVGRLRHVLLPAALPGYLAGLKQGWAFSWRSLMAAELITYSPALGIGLGQQLNIGRQLNAMDLVIASIFLILAVGVAIELLVFAPLERRVLRARGLTVARGR